jgi:hypothetical protein
MLNVIDPVNKLEAERRADRQGRMAGFPALMEFIALDEFGGLPVVEADGRLQLHPISPAYEQTSAVITTNLALGEWPSAVGDANRTMELALAPTLNSVMRISVEPAGADAP